MMMSDEEIVLGGIKINVAMSLVTKNGQNLGLEPKWTQVLTVLARHVNKPVTREMIIQAVWSDYIVGEDSLNRAISQIRKVLASEPALSIDTIRGIGYQLIHEPAFIKIRDPLHSAETKRWSKWWTVIVGIMAALATAFLIFLSDYGKAVKSPSLKETVITSDLGIENAPSVSPDNKYIAYLWNGGQGDLWKIYIKDLGSENTVKFTKGNYMEKSPVWSNDGTKLAYFSSQNGKFILMVSPFIVNKPTPLDTLEHIVYGTSISWSADDKQLIYSGSAEGHKSYRVYHYDIASGKQKVILGGENEITHYAHASFSPDGSKIAVLIRKKHTPSKSEELNQAYPVNIQVYEYDGMQIIYDEQFDMPIQSASWKDDRTILFVLQDSDQYGVEELDINTNKRLRVFSTQRILRNPGYNAVSNTIYVESWYGNVNLKQIKIKGGAVTDRANFLSSSRYDWGPTLTDDETKLAFVSARSGLSQIWIHDFETGSTRQLSQFENEAAIRSLAWNHQNNQVILGREEKRNKGYVVILDMGGNVTRRLSFPDKSITNPTFAADDQAVYIVLTDSTGNKNTWQYELEDQSMSKIPIDAIDMVQLGDHFYYMKEDRRGIWKIPITGDNQESLVDHRLSSVRSRYWKIIDDTLVMINIHGYKSTFESVDLKTGRLIDSVKIDGFVPSLEPSAVFFRDGRVIMTMVDGLETEIISLSPNN